MDGEKISRYSFIVILLLAGYVGFLIAQPFLTYIVLSFIFYFIFKPMNLWLRNKLKSRVASASLMTIFLLVIIILPSLLFTTVLVREATTAIIAAGNNELLDRTGIDDISAFLSDKTNQEIDLRGALIDAFSRIMNFLIKDKGVAIISSVADIFLGIFIMFFCLYYLFKKGETFFSELRELIPLKKQYKARLFNESENMLHAVLYGQILTSTIQGLVGGIGLVIFQIPNALLWTFLLIIFCFIPVTGSWLVMIPASLYLFISGNTIGGFILLAYGLIIVANVDNIIKPKLIGNRSKVHPVVILIGVLGGLRLFGFIGLLIGPILLSLLIILIRFYVQDYSKASQV